MASSGKIPENVLKEIEEGSAGSKEYEAQKKRNLKHFKKFLVDVENVNDDLEELMKYPDTVETYIKNYFMALKFQRMLKTLKQGSLRRLARWCYLPWAMPGTSRLHSSGCSPRNTRFEIDHFIITILCLLISSI